MMTYEQRQSDVAKILMENDITFSECVGFFGDGDDNPYVAKAHDLQVEGEIEVDSTAVISESDDGGAYVMAWLWVSNEEAGIESEDSEEGDEE